MGIPWPESYNTNALRDLMRMQRQFGSGKYQPTQSEKVKNKSRNTRRRKRKK